MITSVINMYIKIETQETMAFDVIAENISGGDSIADERVLECLPEFSLQDKKWTKVKIKKRNK